MKYEIILLDSQSQMSDESLDFVRKLQQFIELNYKDTHIVKVSISEDFAPIFDIDSLKKTINV